ncbi:MAG TPA: hypothetical protein VIX17_22225 [Pyrinomonadaceae bacterium]
MQNHLLGSRWLLLFLTASNYAFGVVLCTEKLAEKFDLFEVAGTPGANDEVQSELQPFIKPERAFH